MKSKSTFLHKNVAMLALVIGYAGFFSLIALVRHMHAQGVGHTVVLTWDETSNEVSYYNVLRSQSPTSGFVQINPSPIYVQTYQDVNVDGLFYYQVVAVNPWGESQPSATATADARPAPPTNLKVDSVQ